MIAWLSQNWGTLLVAAVLCGVVALIIVGTVKKSKKSKTSCGCGGGCAGCAGCSMGGCNAKGK